MLAPFTLVVTSLALREILVVQRIFREVSARLPYVVEKNVSWCNINKEEIELPPTSDSAAPSAAPVEKRYLWVGVLSSYS